MRQMDMAIDDGNRHQEQAVIGQGTLFGDADVSAAPASRPPTEPTGAGGMAVELSMEQLGVAAEDLSSDWDEATRLRHEKEALGFYITGHPLERVQEALAQLSVTPVQALADAADGREVTVAGLVVARKVTTTRRGDRMAYVRLEDLTGTIEVIVFPDLFATVTALLETDQPVIVTGALDRGEHGVKLKALRLQPLAEAQARRERRLLITLGPAALSEQRLEQLREVLGRHRGPCPVSLTLQHPERRQATVALDQRYWVAPTAALEAELASLIGAGAFTLHSPPPS
jgi:DNA polymerase-3 subunit alpha